MANLMDGSKASLECDDRTGEMFDPATRKRMDIAAALHFVQVAHVAMLQANVNKLMVSMSVLDMCRYSGWTPLEIAYAQQTTALTDAYDDITKQGG